MMGGPWDGQVTQVREDGPRVIAIAKAGGGYVRDDDSDTIGLPDMPRLYVWCQVDPPRGWGWTLVVAVLVVAGFWLLAGLGLLTLLDWWL